ncbi:MAG: glycosyltransferase [PVC group bacterium]|nr:glycosyltransferase [PVC group bacterium]
MNLPTISIITVAKNCEESLLECYRRIDSQDYPKEKIELLLIDGGSCDGTKEVAKKYSARVVDGGYSDNQEARRYVGFCEAKNDILAYIDADNLLPDVNWLKEMVHPFVDDAGIIATQTLRYGYEANQTALNKYFALFGACDPVAFYLGKADRLPWFSDKWNLSGKIEKETDLYYKINFEENSFPTLGCNGFLVRRKVFESLECTAEHFLHTDVLFDLLQKGFYSYGIVKNTVIHATANTYRQFIGKRMRYMQTHHQQLGACRRYKVFDSKKQKDTVGILKFILFSTTGIIPLFDSIRGYLKVRERAWFLHPFVCIGFLFAYGYSSIAHIFSNWRNRKGLL